MKRKKKNKELQELIRNQFELLKRRKNKGKDSNK